MQVDEVLAVLGDHLQEVLAGLGGSARLGLAELVTLEKEVADLSGRLEVRKLVDRAKSVLQTQHGMDEPAAFRWIQRTSMDRRQSMRTVAEGVLDGSALPEAR